MVIKVSIIGATGYAGLELVRLLYSHPEVEIYKLVSKSYNEKAFSDVYLNFKGLLDEICSELDTDDIGENSDVIFLSLPHGTTQDVIGNLYRFNKIIIDLSADFRYADPKVYKAWYNTEHKYPELLPKAVYGLPELNKEAIKKANLIGNPGCYPTCSILGLLPLINSNIINMDSIIIDAKSGATGAGRSLALGLHFCECNESIKAYNIAVHRHTSEIEQQLSMVAKKPIVLSFTPHLIPMKRGILSTIYCNMDNGYTTTDLLDLYKDFYCNEPFVKIYEEDTFPETKNVTCSNFCHIGLKVDKRLNRIVVISAIDNLIKGAAGQAIQNMNLIMGFPETTALNFPGTYL